MVLCKFFQKGSCHYGNSCRFDHIYDSKYSYRAPHLESTKSSSVNSSWQSSTHGTSSASALFRSAAQNATNFGNTSSHTFGPSQPARPSVFDRLGPQPSNVFSNQNQAPQARSIFAQANQNLIAQSQPMNTVFQTNHAPNVFQTNQTPNVFQTNQTTNVFQAHSEPVNIFQACNQPPNAFQTNSQPNIFQTQRQSADPRSIFAQATQNVFGQQATSANITQQSSAPSMNGNVFQTSNKPTNVFATHNAFDQNQINEDDIYSKIEDLSPSDIEAFESADFKLGFIPELPPPRALCAM